MSEATGLTDRNRSLAMQAVEGTVVRWRALVGAVQILGLAYLVFSDFDPIFGLSLEDTLPLIMMALTCPMVIWSLAAMWNGGRFAWLSLAPREIWKPVLLSALVSTLLLGVPVLLAGGLLWATVPAVITVLTSSVIALFVTTTDRVQMRLQLKLVIGGGAIAAALWLALSLAMPVAMNNQIPSLTKGEPYKLLVPSRRYWKRYIQLQGEPDFWTFQTIIAEPLYHRNHMILVVSPGSPEEKIYNWSFLSGFQFRDEFNGMYWPGDDLAEK